jgi:hypothetical protein
MSHTQSSTEKLFNDIASFIDQSRTLLHQGALTELAGLDEQVRILCDAVLQLSQDERVRYADKLQELLGGLKALGDEMVVSREKLANEIRGVSHLKKANTAYRTAEAIDNYDENAED